MKIRIITLEQTHSPLYDHVHFAPYQVIINDNFPAGNIVSDVHGWTKHTWDTEEVC